jgi:hypothetical protein
MLQLAGLGLARTNPRKLKHAPLKTFPDGKVVRSIKLMIQIKIVENR